MDLAVAAAFVASAALNGYLLLRPSMRGAAKPSARPAAIAAVRPISLLPDDISDSLPCEEQLAEVNRRLGTARTDLDARQTSKERFDKGTPDLATETEVKPVVAAMFAEAPADFRYELECRSRICRITNNRGNTEYDWLAAIQVDEYRDRWSSMSFESNLAYLQLRDSP